MNRLGAASLSSYRRGVKQTVFASIAGSISRTAQSRFLIPASRRAQRVLRQAS
jgi:hypothetical protein